MVKAAAVMSSDAKVAGEILIILSFADEIVLYLV
jgi:hypothetical protein